MHQHQEPLQEQKAVSDQHRVTPEELIRALAAIESRRMEDIRRQEEAQAAEQAYLSSTIPVEDAVQELNLQATPEEIWAEIQAQREAQGRALPDTAGDHDAPRPPLPQLHTSAHPQSGLRWPIRRSVPVALALSAISIAVTLSLYHHRPLSPASTTPASIGSSSVSGFAYSVSSLPDRVPFEMDGEGLMAILCGEDTTKIGVNLDRSVDPNRAWDLWSLIKYDGHVYFRGYVAAPPDEKSLPGTTPGAVVDINSVAAAPENGNRPVTLTLRVDTLKYYSLWENLDAQGVVPTPDDVFAFRDQKITVSDIHLDQHAWEQARFVMSTREPALFRSSVGNKVVPFPLALTPTKSRARRRVPDAKLMMNTVGTPISRLPDEKPFVLSEAQVRYLMTGTPLNILRLRPVESYPSPWPEWSAVKHQNRLYLRGWVTAGSSQADMARGFLHLYNQSTSPELGGTAKQISLPLDHVQYEPGGRFYRRKLPLRDSPFSASYMEQQILLANAHIDGHAWEKW